MPRLFTAIEIPATIAEQLTLYRGGLPGAHWIEPSDYHITLRFLGDVETRLAETFHQSLDDMRPRGSFTVTLDGLASFGGDRPRAVYASVTPSSDLTALQADHERLARRAGLEAETRKYTPHLTLARLDRRTSAESVAHYLSQMGVFRRVSFPANRVALYSARDSRGGGPYRIEVTYPLDGTDDRDDE